MTDTALLHELIVESAFRSGNRRALTYGTSNLNYEELAQQCEAFAGGLLELGLERSDRVGIYLEKRLEFVVSAFGSVMAGGVFVPLNPLLKADQICHILCDCDVRILVTSAERLSIVTPILEHCRDLRLIIIVGDSKNTPEASVDTHKWQNVCSTASRAGHRIIDTDMASILYTSGSTGRPKGVVLSHRNMVIGAKSVASYLGNTPDDTLLAALPLSFDAGFSQLTTAFHASARVVLINYLLPRDVLNALKFEQVTGLTAVPPLWIQLAQLDWPDDITHHLRYIANTGGRMPQETLANLRQKLPKTQPFLMYGLTEAFRATYLPPHELDKRPDSIGKAIPNTEVLVLREDGSECAPNEPGELVQRGALVGLGYWNDPEKTAERYKPLPLGLAGRQHGLVLPEIAVFSGDTVRRDEDGFLYFIGRQDEMIKTSGYRVSPTEIEEILYATKQVWECAAFGVTHETLGQSISVVVVPAPGVAFDIAELKTKCRTHMPAYMVPTKIHVSHTPLPRNHNGKIDRNTLAALFRPSPAN